MSSANRQAFFYLTAFTERKLMCWTRPSPTCQPHSKCHASMALRTRHPRASRTEVKAGRRNIQGKSNTKKCWAEGTVCSCFCPQHSLCRGVSKRCAAVPKHRHQNVMGSWGIFDTSCSDAVKTIHPGYISGPQPDSWGKGVRSRPRFSGGLVNSSEN